MLRRADDQNGFTLMEMTTVVAVLAIIAAIAYPVLTTQIKKVRSEEGFSALTALYMAQKSYFQDTGAYTGTLAALEVTIPAMQNFGVPTVYASTTSTCGGSAPLQLLASTADVNSEYVLYVLTDGRIVCTPCAGVCLKLGFPAW